MKDPHIKLLLHKIEYRSIDHLDGNSRNLYSQYSWYLGGDNWEYTRQQMFTTMVNWGLQDGDPIFHSDLDEIPRSTIVQELRECYSFVNPGCFNVKLYYYGFEYMKVGEKWFHPNL